METGASIGAVRGVFIFAMVLFGIMAIIQLTVWNFLPQLSDDVTARCQYFIVKIFIVAISTFSQILFWFLVIVSGYYFIFFKWQQQVYLLLPKVDHFSSLYYSFDVVFGLVTSTKLVWLIYKIYFEQCSFDMFLIDWEKPKTEKIRKANDLGQRKGVNAWRSLLLLNELNELQIYKIISTEFTLITYAFFMDGIGFRYFSN